MPSRRRFITTTATASAALAVAPASTLAGAQQSSPASGQASNDLVLVNGRIHTMDARSTVVRSVTVRGGRIVAAGNAPPSGATGRRIDLRGRTVVPGLIEPHVHMVSLANRPGYHTPLENTTSIREIQETLAARRKAVPEGQWITSMGGWHTNQWAEHRHPTLKELDEAVPDRPVLLYERFTGPCATNTLGKRFFDAADAAAPPHPNYQKINVSDSGVIAGVGGKGGPSSSALYLLRRLQTFEDKKRNALRTMAYSTSLGLTAWLERWTKAICWPRTSLTTW